MTWWTMYARPYSTGTYGYNGGYGVRAGASSSEGVPVVIDVKVSFSEPIIVSCGVDNDKWTSPQQFPGKAKYIP